MAEGQLVLRIRDDLRRLGYPESQVYVNQDTHLETLVKKGIIAGPLYASPFEEKLRREGLKIPKYSKPDILILDVNRKATVVIEVKDALSLADSDIRQAIIYGQKLGVRATLVINESEARWFNPLCGVEGAPITLDGVELRSRPMRFEELEALLAQLSSDRSSVTSTIAQEKSIERLARSVWQQIFASARVAKEQEVLLTFSELILWKIVSERNELDEAFTMQAVLAMPKGTRVSYYKHTVRSEIRKLYPRSLNGFFLNSSRTHEDVFEKVLSDFLDFGSISGLNVDLKSHMYEIFLESSPRIRTLGQFFTPRVLCKALIHMGDVSLTHRIHDPACGTGGFLIESAKQLIHHAPFKEMNITGEEVDQTVHLLAMSNFFISGIAEDFNVISSKIVRSKDSGVGSLGRVNAEAYDRVFANPPYVRTGIQSLKKNMSPALTLRAGMLQGFFLEKIVRELAPAGRAFVVMPFGILVNVHDKRVRDWVLQECHLDGIISLPTGLFRNSLRKTYVLCLTKKKPGEGMQSHPVFGYIVKSVGFTLDTGRERIPDNDLMDDLVPQWSAWDKQRTPPTSEKCHLIPFSEIAGDPSRCMIIEQYFPADKLKSVGSFKLEEDYNEEELRLEIAENFGRLGELLQEYSRLTDGGDPS